MLALFVGGDISHGAVVWGALCGIRQAFGVWWFYAALGSGPMSVVSPLTAILVAAIPVGVGLALGERPGPIAGVGVVLALVAVVLVSRETTDKDVTPHRFTTKVAWLTVGSGVAFGLNFVLIAQAPPEAKLWPLVFARIGRHRWWWSVIAAVSGNLRRAERAYRCGWRCWPRCWTSCANVAMLLALQASLLSLAGVLMSLYPAATVLLAIVVLRERVTRWQAVGMVLALAAVAMIAAG